ncbi:AraC family transcriptional regulator [Streptomyces sp. NBC_01020]|uniref:AraC family transcriptional regulator n=1 Tax=unclassified Streptomyces TaxID=2593676 RepID=UPI0032537CDF|nr:AraC family transcriptional regulator [Streptomyces sp. NBC_01020]WSX70558.1 AraC family transcriptional regulator [Streptomyces sp. NBC_00932]
MTVAPVPEGAAPDAPAPDAAAPPGSAARTAELLGELRTLIVRHAGRGPQLKTEILDGVAITCAYRPTLPVSAMAEPSLAVVGQGVKRTILNGVPHDYRAGQYLVVSVDLPVTGQALEADEDEPFVVFSMTLDPAAIAPLLLETGNTTKPPAFTGLAVSDATPELLDPVVRLLRLLGRPDDLRVLAPGIEREILWRLITGDQGALVRQIGLANSSIAHISRTIRWIRRHYDEPLRIADLADLAGMSPSAFHRHFRSATSMTPIQFQKQIRLREARALLLTGPVDVADIGHRVGYGSPSQFSREYRKAFGAPPGRDAARHAEHG